MRGAKRRFEAMFSSTKSSEKSEFKKWQLNKEYTLSFHDNQTSEMEILLNSEIFKGIDDCETIEISFVSKPKIKLIFQIDKAKNLEKTKANISLLSSYIDLIKTHSDFIITKSKVFVHVPVRNDFVLDQANLIFKERFISRKDIFNITQSLIEQVIYQNQPLKLCNYDKEEEVVVGYINLKSSIETPLTGIITSSTNFNLFSIAADVFFVFEISNNSFNFTPNLKMRYELVIDYFKIILTNMQQNECHHRIHIMFYTRIFFKKKTQFTKLKYINQSNLFPEEYYIDAYSMIDKELITKMEIPEICKSMYQAFELFGGICSYSSINEFIETIKNSFEFHYDHATKNQCHDCGFGMGRNGYSKEFFDDVEDFRLSHSNTTNLFEAVCVVINEINAEQNQLNKIGTMINVITSGDHFPYYCNKLADKVYQFLYEEYIHLNVIITANRTKFEMYQNASMTNSCSITCGIEWGSKSEHEGYSRSNSKNKLKFSEFLSINNFSHKPPEWVKPFFVPDAAIQHSLSNITEKHKVYYNQQNEIDKESSTEIGINYLNNVIDNDIFNLNNRPRYNTNGNRTMNSNDNYNDNDRKCSFKCVKKTTLEDIKDKYNIFKETCNTNCKARDLQRSSDCFDYSFCCNRIDDPTLIRELVYDSNIFQKDTKIKQRRYHTSFISKTVEEPPMSSPDEKEAVLKDLLILEDLFMFVPIPSFFALSKKFKLDDKFINLYTMNITSSRIEEMILARINANFQIMTTENHTDQKINFNKLTSISLCNRKSAHDLTISGESCEFRFRSVERSHDQFTYYFLIYDEISNMFFMKKTIRKEQKDWATADSSMDSRHIINELVCIDNLNEQTTLKYLLIDKKKKVKKGILHKAPTIAADVDIQFSSLITNVDAHLSMNLPILTNGNSDLLKIHSYDPKKSQDQLMASKSEIPSFSFDLIAFPDRVNKLLIDLEASINKQISTTTKKSRSLFQIDTDNNNNKKEDEAIPSLASKTQYVPFFETDHEHKKENVSLYHLQNHFDWISIFLSSEYNEKTGIFLSIQWISCKSVFIDYFIKEINKLAKRNNFRLVEIHAKYFLNFNFNRTAKWYYDIYEKQTIIETIQLIVFNDGIRCEYELNSKTVIVLYQESLNMLVKFIDNSIILYSDCNENTIEHKEIYAKCFMLINDVVDLYKFFKKKLNDVIRKIESNNNNA